jgi:protein TonB
MTVMIDESRSKPWLRKLLIGLGAVLSLAAVVLIAFSLLGEKSKPKKQTVHQIALLRPPPPPPPPKPEKPPEPEIKKEEVKIEQKVEQPKETQSDQPEGKQLALDADGSAGSDGFGLGANKGGRDLLAGGTGKAGFAFYTAALQRHLHDEIARHKGLRNGDFRVVLRLWLGRDGAVQRFELVGSSGNGDTDELIKAALAEARVMREPPPESMPQPIKVRITARGLG